ncbi:MAG: MerR family transcriptional regulator [Anaerolineales bacterium]|nr:MerR family transcriptional regulator [Anaerolineales bacterium]MCB9147001.1 MerR family transcriptional regulator [Anaerolineales bacterium]
MLKIGDFSQLAQVSVRALRIYDEMGLIKPIHVDKFSGYRYYEASQLPRLNRIIALKDLGFTLEQIAQALKENLSAEQLRGMLMMKQAELEQELKEGKLRLMRVAARLRQIEREGGVSPYEVTVKSVRPLIVISSKISLATLEEIVHVRCGMYESVYRWLEENHLTPLEPELALYDNKEYVETDINMEVGAIVEEKVWENRSRLKVQTGGVELRQLPAVEEMASVIHHGKLLEVGDAIGALFQWVGENGYEANGAYRELHLFGREITCTDEDNVTVEVQLPFRKP